MMTRCRNSASELCTYPKNADANVGYSCLEGRHLKEHGKLNRGEGHLPTSVGTWKSYAFSVVLEGFGYIFIPTYFTSQMSCFWVSKSFISIRNELDASKATVPPIARRSNHNPNPTASTPSWARIDHLDRADDCRRMRSCMWTGYDA